MQRSGKAWLGPCDLGPGGAHESASERKSAPKEVALGGGQSAPDAGGLTRAQIDCVEDDGSALLDLDHQAGLATLHALDQGQVHVEEEAEGERA